MKPTDADRVIKRLRELAYKAAMAREKIAIELNLLKKRPDVVG